MTSPVSGNSNATIAYPGPHWRMYWDNGEFGNFQLDIVGFLAVLGEGSVTANAQVSALSSLFYLPRLMPAPQALLWPTRPDKLPSTEGTVTGVESGNVIKHVHHVAHILLGDEMPPFMVRCVEVTKSQEFRKQTWQDRVFRGEQRQRKARAMTRSPAMGPPLITAKANGPLTWVTLLGFLLAICMFVISLVFGDGMSMIATILLSTLSTLIGFVNKWSLRLPQRPKSSVSSIQGSVVIRYPNGSFLVVKCDEDVARELYFAPEEIDYNIKSPAVYRLISLAGTLMLMLGVIALANSKLELQFSWAGAFIFINAAHWTAAAVPARVHWDLSCYEIKEQSVATGPKNPSFTEALWKAILFTKSIGWVKNGEAAPRTEVWDQWLSEAKVMSESVKSHPGELIDPKWPGRNPEKGIVFDVPKYPEGDYWDAKWEWDKIDLANRAEQLGMMAPAKAA